MNERKKPWSHLMQVSEQKPRSVKRAVVIAALAHLFLISAIFGLQGCGTPKAGDASSQVVPHPEQPAMPPSSAPTNVAPPPPPPAAFPVFKPVTDVVPAKPVAAPELTGGASYTIKSGDSLSGVAARYGVSSRELAQLNNITNPNKLRVGQKILLPSYAKERAVPAKKKTATAAKKPAATTHAADAAAPEAVAGDVYTVKSGDSLSKIAVKLHTSVKALREANGLQSDKLKIDQKLKIPGKSGEAAPAPAPAPEVAPAPVPAPIDPGVGVSPPPATPTAGTDPLAGLAPAAGVPAAAVPPAAATLQTFDVTVEPGDTIASLSAKYGILPEQIKQMNNIQEVAPGQKIKLPLPTP